MVSLFAKVQEYVLEFLKVILVAYKEDRPLPVFKITASTKLCVTSIFFSLRDEFYGQKFGCSMGSALLPVLSNLYMEYCKSNVIPQIKSQNIHWYRYIDDISTVWDGKSGSFVKKKKNRLNSCP